jgi:hypothetical protein
MSEVKNKTAEEAMMDAAEAKAKTGAQKLVKGMAAKLAKCKKVTVKIPIDKQNEKDLEVAVQINGYVFQMKRGVEIEVPVPVKKLLERGKYI